MNKASLYICFYKFCVFACELYYQDVIPQRGHFSVSQSHRQAVIEHVAPFLFDMVRMGTWSSLRPSLLPAKEARGAPRSSTVPPATPDESRRKVIHTVDFGEHLHATTVRGFQANLLLLPVPLLHSTSGMGFKASEKLCLPSLQERKVTVDLIPHTVPTETLSPAGALKWRDTGILDWNRRLGHKLSGCLQDTSPVPAHVFPAHISFVSEWSRHTCRHLC